MELKTYIYILLKKWWIVIPSFLITLMSGIVFTYTRIPVYSATATYVVVPSPSFGDVSNFATGLDILGRRDEIATTYAEIASSRKIKDLAASSMSLPSTRTYSVSSNLLAGTNIIEITVDGPDPIIARDLANAAGSALEDYVKGLYEVFVLVLLDEASTPTSPISPKIPLNIALAAVCGLALGAGLAFLTDYLEAPLGAIVSVNIIDGETGVCNKEYFLQRLGQEMARARHNRYPLSVGLIRVGGFSMLKGADSNRLRAEIIRQVAVMASHYLREEDIVARLDDDVIALILPDMTGENAKSLMEYLQTRIAWTPFESSISGMKINLKSVVGVTAYGHNGITRDELVAMANRALQLAGVEDDGKAYLMTDPPNGEEHDV